jgi:hypothetical protein
VTSSPSLASLVEPQQAQAAGPGTIIRSRGRCAGNGWRAGFLRVKARTCVRRSFCGLLGHKLVFGGRHFQFFEFKVHLVEQTRLALVARGPKRSRLSFSIVSRRCAIKASALDASARACASSAFRSNSNRYSVATSSGENHSCSRQQQNHNLLRLLMRMIAR